MNGVARPARAAARFFVGAAITTAVVFTVVVVWLTRRSVPPSSDADAPSFAARQAAARSSGERDRSQPSMPLRLQRETAAPPDVSERREALESELQSLQTQLDTSELMKRIRSLSAYDPIPCAHMDHPLCPPYAMSAAELDRLADCGGVKLDTPRFMWNDDEPLFDPRWESVNLTSEERARVETALAKLKDDFEVELRKIWLAETKDEADAAALDLGGINFMLLTTNRPSGFDEALRYVSAEVAGRLPIGEPPPHVLEYLRMMVRAGDRIESTLAETIGATKAAQLRRAASGWGSTRVTSAGCPEDVTTRSRQREIAAELAELDRDVELD